MDALLNYLALIVYLTFPFTFILNTNITLNAMYYYSILFFGVISILGCVYGLVFNFNYHSINYWVLSKIILFNFAQIPFYYNHTLLYDLPTMTGVCFTHALPIVTEVSLPLMTYPQWLRCPSHWWPTHSDWGVTPTDDLPTVTGVSLPLMTYPQWLGCPSHMTYPQWLRCPSHWWPTHSDWGVPPTDDLPTVTGVSLPLMTCPQWLRCSCHWWPPHSNWSVSHTWPTHNDFFIFLKKNFFIIQWDKKLTAKATISYIFYHVLNVAKNM